MLATAGRWGPWENCIRVKGDRDGQRRKEREHPENDIRIPESTLTDLKLLMLL